jgi:hypothetical protein
MEVQQGTLLPDPILCHMETGNPTHGDLAAPGALWKGRCRGLIVLGEYGDTQVRSGVAVRSPLNRATGLEAGAVSRGRCGGNIVLKGNEFWTEHGQDLL